MSHNSEPDYPPFRGNPNASINYVSPTINLKSVGLTTIFTVPASVRFIATSYTLICDTATSANGDSVFNVGWTSGSSYSDYLSASEFITNIANNYVFAVDTSLPLPIFPSSTPIIFNLVSGDSGTSLTGRFAITGFYI